MKMNARQDKAEAFAENARTRAIPMPPQTNAQVATMLVLLELGLLFALSVPSFA